MDQDAQFAALVAAAESQLQQLEGMLPECRKYDEVPFGFSSEQLLEEIAVKPIPIPMSFNILNSAIRA
ncbi:MAG: hypothetical protein FWD73_01910 [Polyangiaceae bacterium]|nr:hypothetical protein [Polyangiaceae bacterium]